MRAALRSGPWSVRKFRELPVRHEPPWYAIELGGDYVAVVRRMQDAERGWKLTLAVDVLVAFLVDSSELEALVEYLKTHDVEYVESPDED